MLQRTLKDPRAWFLLLINGYLIYYYLQNPTEFNTIVWIYWLQSILIGFFTFIELLKVENPDETSMKMNDQPVTKKNIGCAAFFFLFHFGFFHLVYAIFLLTGFSAGANAKIVLITGGIFLVESTIDLIRRRSGKKEGEKENIGKMFFVPYMRIIPMHLMILVPPLLGFGTSVIFLILKMLADIGMYIATTRRGTSSSQL
ncbi:MAG: hypothetical protein IPK31_22235 [Chitinophagaceae bacterium]|nr:hypothetical protein [Chitinophagaceae bacterium]